MVRHSAALPLLAWPRFRRLLEAAVLDADPEARRAREQAAAEQRVRAAGLRVGMPAQGRD